MRSGVMTAITQSGCPWQNKEASPRYKSVALATGFSFVLLLIYFIFFAIT
jgi:hypothetical protein